MTQPAKKIDYRTTRRTRFIIAGFWVGLGLIGIVIATGIHIHSPIGYLGPVAALLYGVYDFYRLLRAKA